MEEDKKERISEWFLKSRDEVKPFNKLIYLWISFNIFYCYYVGEPGNTEREKLDNFNNFETNKNLFREMVENNNCFLGFQNYINNEKIHNRGLIKNLTNKKDSDRKYIDVASLKEYIECVYCVRCNLFHGDKKESDSGDSDLVREINPSFEIFLSILYHSYGINLN